MGRGIFGIREAKSLNVLLGFSAILLLFLAFSIAGVPAHAAARHNRVSSNEPHRALTAGPDVARVPSGKTSKVTLAAGTTKGGSLSPSTTTGSIHYLPIYILNGQNESTPSPFQQKIVFDPAAYSSLLNANLSNVEFVYGNGTVVPSWLANGNSNTSYATTYWLRLYSIPADRAVTVYMEIVNRSQNLFNNQYNGEAPTLSQITGQYDDGANVFLDYGYFMNRSLDGWVSGSYTGNFYPQPTYQGILMLNNTPWTGTYVTPSASLPVMPLVPLVVEESWQYNGQSDANMISLFGNTNLLMNTTSVGGTVGGETPTDAQSVSAQYEYWGGNLFLKQAGLAGGSLLADTSFLDSSSSTQSVFSYVVVRSPDNLSAGYLSFNATINHFDELPPNSSYYGVSANTSDSFNYPTLMIGAGSGAGSSTQYLRWVVARSYPPSGQMPPYQYGKLSLGMNASQNFNVTFAEAGLEAGTTWWLNFTDGGTFSSTGSTITATLEGGLYYYSAQTANKSYWSHSGAIESINQNLQETVSFSVSPELSFSVQNNTLGIGKTEKVTVHVAGDNPSGFIRWTAYGGIKLTSTNSSIANGYAVNEIEGVSAGQGNIAVRYFGDAHNNETLAYYLVNVSKTVSTVSITLSSYNLTAGNTLTCYVRVTGYSPTGVVSLTFEGSNYLNSLKNYTVPLVNGNGTVTLTVPGEGAVKLVAVYSGDLNNDASSSVVAIFVNGPISQISPQLVDTLLLLFAFTIGSFAVLRSGLFRLEFAINVGGFTLSLTYFIISFIFGYSQLTSLAVASLFTAVGCAIIYLVAKNAFLAFTIVMLNFFVLALINHFYIHMTKSQIMNQAPIIAIVGIMTGVLPAAVAISKERKRFEKESEKSKEGSKGFDIYEQIDLKPGKNVTYATLHFIHIVGYSVMFALVLYLAGFALNSPYLILSTLFMLVITYAVHHRVAKKFEKAGQAREKEQEPA